MKWPVNFIALWHINHLFLLKYWRYYTVHHSPYKFSDTKAYEEKYEHRLHGMCEFLMVFDAPFSFMVFKNQTKLWFGSWVPSPAHSWGSPAAFAQNSGWWWCSWSKRSHSPTSRGLGPILCRGCCNLVKSEWSVQPHSPPVKTDSAFSAGGVVSSPVPGETSIGSWRIKATCI